MQVSELESLVQQFEKTVRVYLMLWYVVFNSCTAIAGFRATEGLTVLTTSSSVTSFYYALSDNLFTTELFVQVWKYCFHTCKLCSLLFQSCLNKLASMKHSECFFFFIASFPYIWGANSQTPAFTYMPNLKFLFKNT